MISGHWPPGWGSFFLWGGADFNRFHHQKPLGSIFFSAFLPPPGQKNNGKKHMRAKMMCKYPISGRFLRSERGSAIFFTNLEMMALKLLPLLAWVAQVPFCVCFFFGVGGGNCAGAVVFGVEIDSTNGLDWVVFSAWFGAI